MSIGSVYQRDWGCERLAISDAFYPPDRPRSVKVRKVDGIRLCWDLQDIHGSWSNWKKSLRRFEYSRWGWACLGKTSSPVPPTTALCSGIDRTDAVLWIIYENSYTDQIWYLWRPMSAINEGSSAVINSNKSEENRVNGAHLEWFHTFVRTR